MRREKNTTLDFVLFLLLGKVFLLFLIERKKIREGRIYLRYIVVNDLEEKAIVTCLFIR